ncbi:NAD-dependent epimerase/dehydratase family protein [Vibrio sp. RC27]
MLLLTGATGFIGSEVKKANEGKIICLVRRGQAIDAEEVISVDGIHSETDWSCIKNRGIEQVVHLAGLAHNTTFTDEDYEEVNCKGTLKLASEAAKYRVKRFVFVSSIVVHGVNTSDAPFTPRCGNLNPNSPYARSKLNAEIGLREISEKTGMELVIVRPTLVYGKEAPGNFGLLTKLIGSVPILPFGAINNRRSFISVYNLADLLLRCAHHPNANGKVFLAAENETISTSELISRISEGLGVRTFLVPLPSNIMKFCFKLIGKTNVYDQLYGNLEVETDNLENLLGWAPPYSIEESMMRLRQSK